MPLLPYLFCYSRQMQHSISVFALIIAYQLRSSDLPLPPSVSLSLSVLLSLPSLTLSLLFDYPIQISVGFSYSRTFYADISLAHSISFTLHMSLSHLLLPFLSGSPLSLTPHIISPVSCCFWGFLLHFAQKLFELIILWAPVWPQLSPFNSLPPPPLPALAELSLVFGAWHMEFMYVFTHTHTGADTVDTFVSSYVYLYLLHATVVCVVWPLVVCVCVWVGEAAV